jgi:hypothetical protein
MAVGVTIDIPGGTKQQHERVIAAAFPEGRLPAGWLVHLAGPTRSGWRVVNVAPSQEQFEAFAVDQLIHASQQVLEALPTLTFFPVHTLIRN